MRRVRWGVLIQGVAVAVGILGGLFGIAAFFTARRANEIATAGTFPDLRVISTSSLEFALPASDAVQHYFCRTELRIANTGGAGTAIIGVDPIGDFGKRGFLPSVHRRAVGNIDLKTGALAGLVVSTIVDWRHPVALLARFLRTVAASLKVTVLNGPFPYALAVTGRTGVGLLPTRSDKPPEIRSVEELRKAFDSSSYSSSAPARRLFDLMLPASGATGLPYLVPANTVEDIAIDFDATFPPGVDLFAPDKLSFLEQSGINLHVGYVLKFPDAAPLRIAPTLCGSTGLKDNSAAIAKLLQQQGWMPGAP